MIEKDNIQELFSKAFENHASAVKPELWTGVQAKMAAAGMVGGTAAVKGISALTKWIIGTAAVTTIGVTTYLVVDNTTPAEKPADSNTMITKPSSSESPSDYTKTVALDQTNANTIQNSNGKTLSQINPENTNPVVYDGGFTHNSPANAIYSPDPYYVPHNSDPINSGNEGNSTKGTETNNTPESSPAISKEPANPKETILREPAASTSSAEVKEAKVEVPNVFSPNFDTKNDYFELISEENVSKVEITIYDPNGRKVFISNDKNFKWDGNNMSGETCGQGIYSYQLVYFDLNGKANLKGDYIYLQR